VTTEVVPQPKAVDGVVFADVGSRTLPVRLPDAADSHTRSLWRGARQTLMTAEQAGWRSRVPDLWAHTDRRRNIAHGKQGAMATVRFVFHKNPGLSLLRVVSRHRLTAIVTIDQTAGHFLGVRFLHRPWDLGLGVGRQRRWPRRLTWVARMATTVPGNPRNESRTG
jgi:hypothetical protein